MRYFWVFTSTAILVLGVVRFVDRQQDTEEEWHGYSELTSPTEVDMFEAAKWALNALTDSSVDWNSVGSQPPDNRQEN
jgi:hypothetical protein